MVVHRVGSYSAARVPLLIVMHIHVGAFNQKQTGLRSVFSAHRAGDRWDSLLFSGTMLQPAGETPEQHTCLRGGHVAPAVSVTLRCYIPVVMTRMLHICKQPFSAFQPVSVSTWSTSCSLRRSSGLFQGWLPTNKAHGVMKPNFKAGTMLGSPNSLSLRQTEPRLTSQSPGEAAPKLPAPAQETQAERPGENLSSRQNIRLPLKGPDLTICYCFISWILFISGRYCVYKQ